MSRTMRLPRLRRWLPFAIALFVVFVAWALWPAKSKFTVSPETTYVTDTVDENGFVDYPKVLNDRLSQGVTPENNAKVLIMQALGPKPEGAEMPAGFFQRIGMERPPDDGAYLLSWDKFFKAPLNDSPDDVMGLFDSTDSKQHWDNEQELTRKWPWKTEEHPEIAEWLSRNEKPLVTIAEACKRTHFYNPLLARNQEPQSLQVISSLLPSVQKCRAVAVLLSTRAMLRVGEGEFDGAWRDLMVCQKLGRLVARGGTLIEGLVGIAIVSIAANTQIVFLNHVKQPAKQILAWKDELSNLPSLPGIGDKLNLAERFMMLDVMMSMIYRGPQMLDKLDGPLNSPPSGEPTVHKMLRRSVDYDPALRLVNAMYDRCAAACRLSNRAERKRELDTIEREIKEMKRQLGELSALERIGLDPKNRGEYMGRILATLMLPAIAKVQDATDRAEQTMQNLQVAFALAAYRAEKDKYPAALDELAPKYIVKIPDDLFASKPLVYRLEDEGYLLYSIGVNEKDEGGHWTDDEPRGDDLRVRMPVSPPKK